jgi:hypothetical protein
MYRRGLVAGLSVLGACADPISNQVFLDEALFLGALPSEARFGAPQQVLVAPNGDASVLRAAKVSAAGWDGWWALPIAAGDQLRVTVPDERTDVKRRWEAVNVATRLGAASLGFDVDDVIEFWVQAEILQPDGGDVEWTMAVALSEDGPWTGVGSGLDRGGAGEVSWDLSATVGALEVEPTEPPGLLTADYTDVDPDFGDQRTVDATLAPFPGIALPFYAASDSFFAFTANLSVTDDGAPWPGGAMVLHTAEGGRAEGVVLQTIDGDEAERTFASCWDGSGTLLWQTGDPGISALGDASACTIEDPF